MYPFTKQGNCPRTLIRKSPYTKALPGLRIRVPKFDIPFIIQQSCVFNLSLDNRGPFLNNKAMFLICHWTTDDLFRITMQCFKSPGHNGIGFPTVLTLLFTQQYNAFNLCS
ncbi:hypothetical protein TNCT_587601 [Trichonephila clavata]|uniref:Uncharacterized protein n=1 Tax=Trichonephila clavata TaxID=2740835 RepID=A0A8X6L587_TRICU|nr:hypothetical protein TNCT_587601 [Trichonephila clavata]